MSQRWGLGRVFFINLDIFSFSYGDVYEIDEEEGLMRCLDGIKGLLLEIYLNRFFLNVQKLAAFFRPIRTRHLAGEIKIPFLAVTLSIF